MAVGQVNGTFIYNGQPQNGATAKLWDREVFYTTADSGETVQNNPMTAAQATFTCSDGTQFAAGDLIEIGTEHLFVISVAGNELTVQRGYDNTTPAAHVLNTAIYDLTQDDPDQDDAEPGSGQHGASLTTGITYGGDGAYRWIDVPDGEYFVSVEYDGHRAWLHVAVEARNTLSQILKLEGDIAFMGANAIERLPKGSDNDLLQQIAGQPSWVTHALGGSFNELYGAVHNAGGAAAFEDWDVSAQVPAGTTAVLVGINDNDGTNDLGTEQAGARNNGSALNRYIQVVSWRNIARPSVTLVTPVDAARILEIYDAAGALTTDFRILGYWV